MNTYKGQTLARRKANKKYLSEKVDSINVRFPKGMKEILRKRAEKQGLSLNQYCRKAIIDTYIKDSSIADLAIFDTIYKTEIAEFDRKPTTNEENDNADDMWYTYISLPLALLRVRCDRFAAFMDKYPSKD